MLISKDADRLSHRLESLWGLLLAGDSCSQTEIRPSTKRWKWGELSLDVGEIVLS